MYRDVLRMPKGSIAIAIAIAITIASMPCITTARTEYQMDLPASINLSHARVKDAEASRFWGSIRGQMMTNK